MKVFEQIGDIIVSAIVSGFITGVGFKYVTRYFDQKLEQEEEEKRRVEKQRRDRALAEANRRRAAGRLFFWLHHAIVKPPANGELEKAFEAYNQAEDRQKALEQEILASIEEGQK